jgi:hypothetical protein
MSHVQAVHAARMAEIAAKKERDRAEAAKEAAEKAAKMPLSPPPMPWLKEGGEQQFVDVRTIVRKPVEQELKMKARLPENARSKQMFWGAMDAKWEGNVRVDRALLDSSLATMSGGATALKRHVLDPTSTSPAMARPPGQARAPPPPPEEPQPRAVKPSPRSAQKDVAESRVSRESPVSREMRGTRGTRGGTLETREDMTAQSPPKDSKADRAQSPPKDSKEVAKAQAFWGAMEGKAEGKGPVAKTSPAPSVALPAQEDSRALLDRSLATMSGGVDALNSRALYSAQHL